MTFLERIAAWFKGTPEPADEAIHTAGLTAPKLHIEKPTINTSNMVNTITLSSDMEKLYLIDNGRAIEFKISEEKGILIGTLNGQVTVVTALVPPKVAVDLFPSTDTTIGDPPTPAAPGTTAPSAKPGMPMKKKVAISTKGSQWTIFFNRKNSVMALIGVGEIDTSIAEPDKFDPEFFVFPLKDNVVHIQRKEGKVEFQLVKRF